MSVLEGDHIIQTVGSKGKNLKVKVSELSHRHSNTFNPYTQTHQHFSIKIEVKQVNNIYYPPKLPIK